MTDRTKKPDTLTRWELQALDNVFNLSDGHARQQPLPVERAVLARLPEIYAACSRWQQAEVEANFVETYFAAAGVSGYRGLPFRFHYSCSAVIDVVADLASRRHWRTALLTPTFDNIAALLARHRVQPVPLRDDDLLGQLEASMSLVDAVFLVMPNNPTGFELPREEFHQLCAMCASRNAPILLDASFRFFRRFAYDHYDILKSSGCDFCVIEDTGKTLGHNDLKLGFCVASSDIFRDIADISDDLLLNVSPFLIETLRQCLAGLHDEGALGALSSLARANRQELAQSVETFGLRDTVPHSPIGVSWLSLPEAWDSEEVASILLKEGVGVLPGGPFFWNDTRLGRQFLRVALMRERAYFGSGVARMREALSSYHTGSKP